jgi:hypothetical protein
LSMGRTMDERNDEMGENDCGQPFPRRAAISAHAQETSEEAET